MQEIPFLSEPHICCSCLMSPGQEDLPVGENLCHEEWVQQNPREGSPGFRCERKMAWPHWRPSVVLVGTINTGQALCWVFPIDYFLQSLDINTAIILMRKLRLKKIVTYSGYMMSDGWVLCTPTFFWPEDPALNHNLSPVFTSLAVASKLLIYLDILPLLYLCAA